MLTICCFYKIHWVFLNSLYVERILMIDSYQTWTGEGSLVVFFLFFAVLLIPSLQVAKCTHMNYSVSAIKWKDLGGKKTKPEKTTPQPTRHLHDVF